MKFSTSMPHDCAGIAPHLTALFDGEADDATARAARAHLLSCPACSRLWLDWTRHRDTLQSEPAPAVPPTLLWRVLIAYRVTAFARPARRRSRLPQVSAAPLRGLEAPMPPRLSAHILARTTRRPTAHVMLTPLSGPAPAAKNRWKPRAFALNRAPLWAVPALALWMLTLGRTEFSATLPVASPDSPVVIAPATPDAQTTTRARANAANQPVSLIPVAPLAATAPAKIRSTREQQINEPSAVATRVAPIAHAPEGRAVIARPIAALPVTRAVQSAPLARPIRADARADAGLSRVFLLALNTGRRDIAQARTAPRSRNVARAVPNSAALATETTPIASPPTSVARLVRATPRAIPVVARVRDTAATARVTLTALASPISPVRTVSAARLRAAFSDGSMRSRVINLRAGGQRIARALPEENAIPLRVSRPIAGAPVASEVSFSNANADHGPRLEDVRSAVDDFRASVAGDETFQ